MTQVSVQWQNKVHTLTVYQNTYACIVQAVHDKLKLEYGSFELLGDCKKLGSQHTNVKLDGNSLDISQVRVEQLIKSFIVINVCMEEHVACFKISNKTTNRQVTNAVCSWAAKLGVDAHPHRLRFDLNGSISVGSSFILMEECDVKNGDTLYVSLIQTGGMFHVTSGRDGSFGPGTHSENNEHMFCKLAMQNLTKEELQKVLLENE